MCSEELDAISWLTPGRITLKALDCEGSAAKNGLELSPHDRGINVGSSPILDADNALIYEHAQPVNDFTTTRLGILDQIGARRVGNDIRDDRSRLQ
jgi:hypothetical protein